MREAANADFRDGLLSAVLGDVFAGLDLADDLDMRALGERGSDLPRFSQPVITEDFRISANSFGVR